MSILQSPPRVQQNHIILSSAGSASSSSMQELPNPSDDRLNIEVCYQDTFDCIEM